MLGSKLKPLPTSILFHRRLFLVTAVGSPLYVRFSTVVNGKASGECFNGYHATPCPLLLLPPAEEGDNSVKAAVRKHTSRRVLEEAHVDPILAKAKKALWRLSAVPDEIVDPCDEAEVVRWYERKLAAKASRKVERQKEKEALATRKMIRLGRLALRQLDMGSLRPRELVAKAPKLRSLLDPNTIPSSTAEDHEIYRWYDEVCRVLTPEGGDPPPVEQRRGRKKKQPMEEEGQSVEAAALATG